MLRGLWWVARAVGYLVVLVFVLRLPPWAVAVFVVVLVTVLTRRQRATARVQSRGVR